MPDKLEALLSDSPSEADLFEADPVESDQSDDQAASSPAADGGASLLDSVSEALKGSEQETSPASETDAVDKAAPTDAAAEKAAEDPLGEITDQELSRYGPKTQRRIKDLLAQRAEVNKQLEAVRPKAESYEKIDQFISENGLTNDDVAVVFDLAALIKKEPAKAYDRLQSLVANLGKAIGHELPPDLQERVRLGYLSEEDARELSKAKARNALTEQQIQERDAKAKEDSERRRIEGHVTSCRDTANKWEASRKSTDPDWNEKQQRIGELIELEVYRKGYPQTQEGVVKMLDGFLDQVNKEFSRFKPRPKEVRPLNSGSASSRATAEPKTLMEAVEQALAQ